MRGVQITDHKMDAYGRGEAYKHGYRHDLPKINGGIGSSNDKEIEQPYCSQPSARGCAVVGDEWFEVFVYFFDAAYGDVHVGEILGYKDGCHAYDGDGEAREQH